MHMRRFLASAAALPIKSNRYLSSNRTLPTGRQIRGMTQRYRYPQIEHVCQQPQSLPVELRPYQGECITELLEAINGGWMRVLVNLPRGSGKSIIAALLISHMKHPTRRQATQTLVLTSNIERTWKIYEHCSQAYPSVTIAVIPGRYDAGPADITIASVRSLANKEMLKKFDPSAHKLVMIDEANYAVAAQHQAVLDHFGVLNMHEGSLGQNPVLVGFTATMGRSDGQSLGKVFDHIAFHRTYRYLVERGWLCPLEFALNDIYISGLSPEKQIEKTVDKWLECATDRKSTIVFCSDRDKRNDTARRFQHVGVDARQYLPDAQSSQRTAVMDAFKAGKFPVLVTCPRATSAFDIPRVDCIVLPYRTIYTDFLRQMVEHGTLLCPGKVDCLVIDMHSHMNAIDLPELYGQDVSSPEVPQSVLASRLSLCKFLRKR